MCGGTFFWPKIWIVASGPARAGTIERSRETRASFGHLHQWQQPLGHPGSVPIRVCARARNPDICRRRRRQLRKRAQNGPAGATQSGGQYAHGIHRKENGPQEATKKRRGKAASKRSLPKKPTKKSSRQRRARPREKDPKGGLTAAGRTAFARKDGSHLKPDVTKKQSDMTPQEMRRKGSWAVRFYGRKKLPPLVDRQGTADAPCTFRACLGRACS